MRGNSEPQATPHRRPRDPVEQPLSRPEANDAPRRTLWPSTDLECSFCSPNPCGQRVSLRFNRRVVGT